MTRFLWPLARLLVVAVGCLPIALVATIALRPFWSWLERTTSLESLGHSGPADWCFLVVYGVATALAAGGLAARFRGWPRTSLGEAAGRRPDRGV